jgi:hypothetical protein
MPTHRVLGIKDCASTFADASSQMNRSATRGHQSHQRGRAGTSQIRRMLIGREPFSEAM